MVRIAAAVGVLLALGAVITFAMFRAKDRKYTLTISRADGKLVATKSQADTPYRIHKRGKTVWSFRNETGVDIEVNFSEPNACHVEFDDFINGRPCESKPVFIGRGDKGKIGARVAVDWDDRTCYERPCRSDIGARVAKTGNFERVDPDLQIERDNIRVTWLLAILSALSFLWSYRRWRVAK
jgi:hypothetical protein